METFLAEVARSLRADHPHDLDQVTVVFNNRRSGLFLRRHFAQLDDKPYFLPRIIGIDELISELGNLEIVPNEFLLFELFDIHRIIDGNNRKFSTFEEFIPFGDTMLVDFSEIDLYRVDVQQLFRNIYDLKAIGEWDIESGKLTPFQEKYLNFYRSLYDYYNQLHQRLICQNKAYSGMAYRHVAENIEALAKNDGEKQYCFVGFNAFSACEKTIIEHYIREGRGKLYTDGDAYYYEDTNQEAGHFLRRNRQTGIPIPDHFDDHFPLGNKKITITSCPENILQCKYAGKLLAKQVKNNPENPIEQTALVLADESLLLPVLNSLPEDIKAANITMGYPYTSTAAHALMLTLFSLHQRRHDSYFYHADILGFFSDKYISKTLGTNNLQSILSKIITTNHIIYADANEIESLCQQFSIDLEPYLHIFNSTNPEPDSFLQQVNTLIKTLYSHDAFASNPKEKEAMACLLQIVEYFQDLQQKYHFMENLNVMLNIYKRIAQRRSVAFYGEPLQGLQIMGVLETRNLDFKRIILISANEGILPSGRTNNTLIPYNLKTAFGIPTFHDKDAVYAYNFYRLIQRADEVHLLFSTESDAMGKGAPSRYILQVKRELAAKYPNNITLCEEVISASDIETPPSKEISYPKSEHIMQRIYELAERGLSPSALNKYKNCSLRFFYEYILQLHITEQVAEDMDQSELGTCIHKVLENIYSPIQGVPASQRYLQQQLDTLDIHLDNVLKEHFGHGRSLIGKNHFLSKVAKIQLENFLRSEIKTLGDHNITIIKLEEFLSHTISINNHPVKIAGTADRIDCFDGRTRVIDYKTGRVEEKDLALDDSNPQWDKVKDKWFQVMIYSWLYHHSEHASGQHTAGIAPLGQLGAHIITATWGKQATITPELFSQFELIVEQLVGELLNPELPFTPTWDNSRCQYCPFADCCQSMPTSE